MVLNKFNAFVRKSLRNVLHKQPSAELWSVLKRSPETTHIHHKNIVHWSARLPYKELSNTVGAIDYIRIKQEVVLIRGWIFQLDENIESLELGFEGNINSWRPVLCSGLSRLDVHDTFPFVPQSKYSGFVHYIKHTAIEIGYSQCLTFRIATSSGKLNCGRFEPIEVTSSLS
jgi:hypothetical protein